MSYLSTAPAGGAGSGTVTQVNSGVGLTGGPITAVGTLDFATSLQPMATLTGNASKFLRVNAGETAVEYATLTASPAGLNTEVQFNDGGVMGADAGLTFDKTTGRVHMGITGTRRLNVLTNIGLFRSDTLAEVLAISAGANGVDMNVQNSNQRFVFLATGAELSRLDSAGRWGYLTNSPTHTNTFASTSTGIAMYNTADQTTNYERVVMNWSGNQFRMLSEKGGTGADRAWVFSNASSVLTLQSSGLSFSRSTATTNTTLSFFTGTFTQTSGVTTLFGLTPTYNQTSTAGWTTLLVNPTDSGSSTGTKLLADLQLAGVTKFNVANTGQTTIVGAPGASTPFTALSLQNSSSGIGANTIISMRAGSIATGRAEIHAVAPGGSDTELAFYTSDNNAAATEKVRIMANGNVGIGTTGPETPLQVYVSGGNSEISIKNSTSSGKGLSLVSEITTNKAYVINRENADLIFRTNNTDKMTLSAAGKLSVVGGVVVRTGTTTSSATPTINTDNVDFYSLTAQAVDITSFTTNLSGTPTDGQKLWIAITGTAARAITWGASFEASTVALPTTTVSTNRLDVGFVWNAATSKWRCVAAG